MSTKINLNGKQYEIPQRLTIDQWCKVMSFDFEDPKFYPQIVQAVTGAPAQLLKKAPEEALVLAISLIVAKLNERREVKTLNVSTLKFGEWVDLDIWINMGVHLHLQEKMDVMKQGTKWADEAMWCVDKFAEYRMFTYRQYKILFNLTDKDLEEAKERLDLQPERLHLARSWYKVIVHLANDNILNIDEVTEQPLKKVLNFMALQKERALEEQQKQLEQRRKYDLQRNSR